MDAKTVTLAGGSGFIGRAIARRLLASGQIRVRVLTRNPEAARARLDLPGVEFVRADIGQPASLKDALQGADTIVDAIQFDGYPVENPRRGLTFERIDYAGTVALVDAAKQAGVRQLIYISGAAADENSTHPGFRAKGRAERAIRFAPVFGVPGTGRQKVQPVVVDDLAACVMLAVSGRGHNGTYEIGGPELMTFDEMMRIIMDASGHRRPLFHIPEGIMRTIGGLLEKLPRPMLSRDAVTFVTADNACNIKPLIDEFGINLTPARIGMAYLAKK